MSEEDLLREVVGDYKNDKDSSCNCTRYIKR